MFDDFLISKLILVHQFVLIVQQEYQYQNDPSKNQKNRIFLITIQSTGNNACQTGTTGGFAIPKILKINSEKKK